MKRLVGSKNAIWKSLTLLIFISSKVIFQIRRRKNVAVAFAVLTLLYLIMVYLLGFLQLFNITECMRSQNFYVSSTANSSSWINESEKSTNSGLTRKFKRILLWTSYFDWKDFRFGIGQEPFVRAGCRVTNCITTNDRSYLNNSDAILFHPINYDPINDAPSHRRPNQRYVFYYHEAEPTYRTSLVFQHPTAKGFYNWTMTFRRDSDIYSSEPYGILRRKNNSFFF